MPEPIPHVPEPGDEEVEAGQNLASEASKLTNDHNTLSKKEWIRYFEERDAEGEEQEENS